MSISWLSSHYAEVLFLLLLFGGSNESWHAGMGNAMQFCNLRHECISQFWGSLNLHPGIIPQANLHWPSNRYRQIAQQCKPFASLYLYNLFILVQSFCINIYYKTIFQKNKKKHKTKPNSSYYIVTMTVFSCKVIFRISNQGLRTLLDFTNNMWTHPLPTRIWGWVFLSY